MVAAIKLAIGDKVLNFQSDTATNVDFSQEFHLARFSKVEVVGPFERPWSSAEVKAHHEGFQYL